MSADVVAIRLGAFGSGSVNGEAAPPLYYARCVVCAWTGPRHSLRVVAEEDAAGHVCPEREEPVTDALARAQVAQAKRQGYRDAETRYYPEPVS